MQKSFLSLFCLLLFAALLAPQSGFGKLVDRNVAIVNGDTITLQEVNELAKPYFDQIRANAPPDKVAEDMAKARRLVLERLIEKRLVTQEALKRNLKVSDEELERALQQLVSDRNLNHEEFQKELAAMGMSEKRYRGEVRDQILSSKVINAELRSRILITDEQIRARYHSRAGAAATAPAANSYQLLQIGVTWGLPSRNGTVLTREQAREKAEELREEALSGTSFTDLARKHSDLPSAEDGGTLGSLSLEEMAGPIREAVAKLEPGGISELVEQEPSFLIFKRLGSAEGQNDIQAEERLSGMPGPEERERIRQELYKEELDRQYDQWMKTLRSKAYIKIF